MPYQVYFNWKDKNQKCYLAHYDDELMHWKYKEKYRGPSGEWIYIYDDGSMNRDTRGALNAEQMREGFGNNIPVKKGNVTQLVNTDKERLFSYKEKVNSEGYQYVRYGRLHIHRMNMERHLSSFAEKIKQKGKSLIERFLSNARKS